MIAVLIAAAIGYSMVSGSEKAEQLVVEVQRGEFEILVPVTGELQALNSTDVIAPKQLRSRNLRIRSVKIQDMVPEGTVVDSGDYVATLDRSEADNTLKDIMDELEKMASEYTKTRLDTTIQLRNLRDELINLRFNMEEAEITLEQSKFEPPATIRQARINLDKAGRAYEQAKKNYHLKVEQARADMTEVSINLAKQRRKKEEMEEVLRQFEIRAPAPGMIIYKREWGGSKRTVGSEIHSWDLTVATLPDMSSMVSRTYVNEIDISKVREGQPVRIGVDAFPEKDYTGAVREVANIGEQLPNTDAKVFEVLIELNESDSILRPAMTTSNFIVTRQYEDVLSVPLETVHQNDSLTYVYTKQGTRKVAVLGEANENYIIVEQGLEEGEKILLSVPEEPENYRFAGLELMEVIKQRKEERLEQEKARREGQNGPGERRRRPGQDRPAGQEVPGRRSNPS